MSRRPLPRTRSGRVPTPGARAALPHLAVLAALALSACALIPPQTVADPLGIDGAPVRLEPAATAVAGVAPQQAASCSTFRGDYSHCASVEGITVADLNESRFAGIVARFETSVGLRTTIRAFGLDATTAPESLVFAGGIMDLYVADAESGLAYDPDPAVTAPAEPVVFLLDEDGCAALVCSYSTASTADLAIPLAASGAELDALLEVLTQGGDNDVSGTLAYEIATPGGGPAPFDVTVVLSSPEGTIRF